MSLSWHCWPKVALIPKQNSTRVNNVFASMSYSRHTNEVSSNYRKRFSRASLWLSGLVNSSVCSDLLSRAVLLYRMTGNGAVPLCWYLRQTVCRSLRAKYQFQILSSLSWFSCKRWIILIHSKRWQNKAKFAWNLVTKDRSLACLQSVCVLFCLAKIQFKQTGRWDVL